MKDKKQTRAYIITDEGLKVMIDQSLKGNRQIKDKK